jgi:hypothetical protein
MSQPFALVYLPYTLIAVTLTIWLARTLSHNGAVFLEAVFADPALASAVNRLLVVGFYLINLGWALLLLDSGDMRSIADLQGAIMLLASKLGTLLLLLGVAHMTNLFIFHRVRRGARHEATAK